ncbi:trypsin-like peptidase domain-containing protein [Streptomyces rishiriensis]|uniref:trypsin-like peptidase domain-containing protein n=1 Tax=Streptomyces rishiriensis TaxID=68264 RepID=UPI000D591D5D|nr:trypsin-like peptidase domain-containing protein [Streptomyces rishiriensis]
MTRGDRQTGGRGVTFDAASVAEVLGENGSYGSGYEVDAGLVLTSGHVVRNGDSRRDRAAKVRFMVEGADWVQAYVIWHDECLDAALLAVSTDRSFTSPVRYGELTGADPQHPAGCGVIGFPQVQATPHGREPMGVSGTVDASTLKFSSRYQIQLAPLERRSDWSGMSGAAVFCGPLLIAVVRSVPDGFHAARVNAVPVALLLRDASFRTALCGTGCESPRPGSVDPHSALRAPCGPECEVPALESVELQPLLEAPPRPGPRALTTPYEGGPSVSYLLHPRIRTVPFIGRGPEQHHLRKWADSPRPFDFMTVTGPMGAGKTRLAVELAQCLGDEWVTGFLRTEPPRASPPPALHPLTTSARPILLVIDYAETRPAWLRLVLRALGGYGRDRVPVRLLLLSRVAEPFHDEAMRQCEHAGLRADGDKTLRIGPLEPGDHDPTVSLSDAAHAFVRRLYGEDPLNFLFESAIYQHLPDRPPTDPFSLSLAACAAAITAFEGAASGRATPASPFEVVLAREERYWMRGAGVFGLSDDRETLELLRTLVVTQTLCGGRDVREAAAALRAGRSAHYRHWGDDQPRPDQLRPLHRLLRALYPSHDAEWGRLGPHALSAHLIESAEHDDPGLTRSILTAPGLSRDQRQAGLETLLLGASHRPGLTGLARHIADALGYGLPEWFTRGPEEPPFPGPDAAPPALLDPDIEPFGFTVEGPLDEPLPPDTSPNQPPDFREGPESPDDLGGLEW